MYTLVSKYLYINAGPTQAILKFKIIRSDYKFKIVFELYELHIKNDQVEMCKLIEKQCKQINSQVLEKFSNDLKGSIILDYYDVESYLPILKNTILNIPNNTNNQRYNIILYNKLQVILTKTELIRIYNDLESFYKNYILLETCLKMTITEEEIKPEVVKVCNYKQENQKVINLIQKDNSNLLFQLCINNQLKQLLVHQILNYYLFLPQEQIKIEKNIVNIPNLFSSILFNDKYNQSLLFSLTNIEINEIKIIILKILKNLKDNNQLDSIFIIGLSFLLYFYLLRLVYETHTVYILDNLNQVFNNNEIQEKLLNSQIKIYFKDIDLQFKVFNIELDNINNQIEKTSKKYDYLKAVNQEDFIDKIFNDLKDNKKQKNLINQYNIINLTNLKHNTIDLTNIDIFNKTSTISKNNQLLLDYKKQDDKLETYCLKIFNIFLEDSNKFYLLKKQNNISISSTILNLFPIISDILKNIKNNDKLDDTLTYYNLLIKKVSDDFLPTTLLYIIFQLIVPYMYNNYGIESFNDCLL